MANSSSSGTRGTGGHGAGHGGQSGKPPDWLGPLTQQQIRNRARNTVRSAYRPAYQELNQEQRRAQGLSAKRTQDNKYYQSWLDTQMSAMQAHADAANAQLLAAQHDMNAQQSQLFGVQGDQLTQSADQRAGNVSNNEHSTAFGDTLRQNQEANLGLQHSAAQQELAGVGNANNQLASSSANNFSFIQTAQQKQLNDLDTVLGKLRDARGQLGTKKAADISREIARLQGVEISKAQANRDFAATMQKLNIQSQLANNLMQTRTQNANTSANRLKFQMNQAQIANMHSDRNYQINLHKYNDSVAKDLYQRDHGLGPYKPSKNGTKPPLGQASQNAIYNHISRVRSEVDQLTTQFIQWGASPANAATQAWHALHNGWYYHRPDSGHKTWYWATGPKEGDVQILNAAYNTRSGGLGLTKGDIAALIAMGLVNPGQRLGAAGQPHSTTGGTYGGH